MIDYETFCRIKHHQHERLTVAQIARALDLDRRTVAKRVGAERFEPRQANARASKLDPRKAQIRRWLEEHPYSFS